MNKDTIPWIVATAFFMGVIFWRENHWQKVVAQKDEMIEYHQAAHMDYERLLNERNKNECP